MATIVETFDSIASFIETINTRPRRDGMSDNAVIDRDASWSGTSTYEEANELALYGDIANAEKVQKTLTKIATPETRNTQRAQARRVRAVAGSRPCVPAAIVGRPDSMYRRFAVKTKRPVVNLYYSKSVSGDIDGDEIIISGAKIAEAVQIVERSGVRVNLYVGCMSETRYQNCMVFVRIKDSAKDFDLLRMAYPLINPAFQRRHGFKWKETHPDLTTSAWKHGYGSAWIVDKSTLAELKKYEPQADVLLDYYNTRRKTAEEIATMITGATK